MMRALLALALLASCSSGEPRIAVRDAWARQTVAGQSISAAYVTIDNQGSRDDRLLGAASPAAAVSLHSSSSEGGIARMRALGRLDIPAGSAVELAPGSNHLMLTGLGGPLEPGASIPLTLRFERSGEIEARLEVRSAAPAPAHGGH